MSTNMTETTSAPPKRGALSQEFFKTVFTDRFLFRDIPFEVLEGTGLTEEEKMFALRIYKTNYYNEKTYEDCAHLVDRLDGIYRWQSNSEGPLFFSGSILYLLEVTEKDVNWFIDQVKNSRESA